MTISSANLKENIWNIFNTLLRANVITVNIKGSSGPNTKQVVIQNYSQAFPDRLFDDPANYPFLIMNSPEFSFTPLTFRNRELEGTIEFEILTTQSESADKFLDLLTYTLLNNEDTLRAEGLEELELDSTDSTHYDRNKIGVHSRMAVWRFRFTW
jgi:hypothetical protein